MQLEPQPAETERFEEEKAFVSLLKISLNLNIFFFLSPVALEAFATYFPFINHPSPAKPTGIGLFCCPFDSRDWLGMALISCLAAPRGWR